MFAGHNCSKGAGIPPTTSLPVAGAEPNTQVVVPTQVCTTETVGVM
jgi:hypothetical protein